MFSVYALPLFLLALQDMFSFPSSPGVLGVIGLQLSLLFNISLYVQKQRHYLFFF